MKKLSIVLALIMLVGMFSSCEGIGDEALQIDSYAPKFDVSYEPLPKSEYRRGETFTITTCVTNISGKDLTYSAVINSYYPTIELYCNIDGGKVKSKIEHEEVETYSGFDEFTAKAGQVGSYTYTFILPADATLGTYDVTLSYRGVSETFMDVLVVTDSTSQNENEKYRYSPVTVSSGDASINPIRVGTSTQIQQADGTIAIGCFGMGVF